MERNKGLENIIAAMASIILAMVQGVASPLHPWIHGELNIDSGVFQTVALMMEHGYMPYRDSFDHKGPYLYVLNWLGRRLGGYCGVWYVEIVTIAVAVFFMYKTARLVSSVGSSLIATVVGLSLLNYCFEGGNFAEEYAVPLIAVGTFIFGDYCINDVISRWRILASGFCLGLVLMLRPNMIAVWVVFPLAILIRLVLSKGYRILGEFTAFFFIGVVTVVFPFLIWLFVNHDIKEFIYCYFVFNMKYTAVMEGNRFESGISFLVLIPCMISAVCSLVVCIRKKNRFFNLVYLLYFVFSFVFISLSGQGYLHYGMVLVPVVVYPIACILGELEQLKYKVAAMSLPAICWILLAVVIVVPTWKDLVLSIPTVYADRDNTHLSHAGNNIYEFIHYTSDQNQTLVVYGNWDTMYVLTGKPHATRYSFIDPIGDVDPGIMDEYFTQLEENPPYMIVVYSQNRREDMNQFLADHNYQLLYSENPTPERGQSLWVLGE